MGGHKPIHPFVRRLAVHDPHDFHLFREEVDPDLLLRLAACCVLHLLSPVEVTGDDAQLPVLVAGVVPTQEENLLVFQQEEVNSGYELETLKRHVSLANHGSARPDVTVASRQGRHTGNSFRSAPSGLLSDRRRRSLFGPEVIILPDVQNYSSPDADLIQRVAQADHEAFLVLYDRYASRVYGLALRMMGNAMAAEDIAQEAFLKVWNRAGTFKPDRGSLAAWLLTITRRTALDRIRADTRRTSPGDPFDPETVLLDLPDPQTSSSEARWRSLRLMLTDLPTEQQQVIDLAFFNGLSHSQIAERLQLPLGTVKTRLRLGMEKLRQAWLAPEVPDQDRSSSLSGDVKHTRKASQAR